MQLTLNWPAQANFALQCCFGSFCGMPARTRSRTAWSPGH